MKYFLVTLFLWMPFLVQSQDHLSGPTTESQIRTHKIFDLYAKRYKPDEKVVAAFNAITDQIQINVFMGTWCHDSKREIPAMFALMNAIDNANISASYTAIEYRRSGPKDIIEKNNIKRTPTFVILKNGKEIGRIIEESEKNLESHLLKIIESKKD